MIKITAPLTAQDAGKLKSGDRVLLSGTVYTARDAAHKRLCELLEKGEELPFDPRGAVIYYVGPTPAPEGRAIGSAGPTTSGRMDKYAPALMEAGVLGMIGKGFRNAHVRETMKRRGAVYFGAIGGAGALISSCIKEAEIIAYEDLGAEAIRKLRVEDMPLTVIMDAEGGDLYQRGREEYLKFRKQL